MRPLLAAAVQQPRSCRWWRRRLPSLTRVNPACPASLPRSFQLYWALVVAAGLFVVQEIVLLILAAEAHGQWVSTRSAAIAPASSAGVGGGHPTGCAPRLRLHAGGPRRSPLPLDGRPSACPVVAARPQGLPCCEGLQPATACFPCCGSPAIHIHAHARPPQVSGATLGAYIFFADLATSFWFGILLAVAAGYW